MKEQNRAAENTDKVFMAAIDSLTPSRLYINADKLENVRRRFQGDIGNMEPVPVRKLAGRLLMTDGHTRAAAVFLAGFKSIPCVLDRDEPDWAVYASDINICAEEGVTSVEKLADRIVSPEDYKSLWNDRCDSLYQEWYYKVLKQEEEIIYFTRDPLTAWQGDSTPCRQKDMASAGDGPFVSIREWYTEDNGEIEYFQLYAEDKPAARGCIERYSYEFWEAADIKTYEGYRNRGFAFMITAYLTNKIVAAGKTATCRTLPHNEYMRCVIEKCGYQKMYD